MVKIKTHLGGMSGKIGNMRLYEVNGETIGSLYPNKAKNPKTEAQMKQRVKLNNILDMYKYIKDGLKSNFEGIVGNRNASSFFRSYNLMRTPVWITEYQKITNKYVVAPYVISQGHIPSIGYEYADNTFVSDIEIADLDINESTCISDIADKIHKHNEGWMYNDTLQVMLLCQDIPNDIDAELSHPQCYSFTIPLLRSGLKPICDIPNHETPTPMPRIPLCNIGGKLGIRIPQEHATSKVYAFALVHGRGEGIERMVSSQQLCLSNNALYDYYTGTDAMDVALDSYKTNRDKPFLKPE